MARMRVLAGGQLIDGRGQEGRADVWLEGDRIAAVHWEGGPPPPEGAEVWDLSGLTLIPGLVDMHSHDDVAAADPEVSEAKLRQGVTTVLISADGLGYAPLDPARRAEVVRYWRPVDGDPGDLWAEHLEAYAHRLKGRLLVHVLPGVPHGNLRIGVAGFAARPLSPEERRRMVREVEAGLEAGAYGVSTGLSYTPAAASDLDELLDLCAPLRRRGIYASHLRNYGRNLFHAVDEALELGRRLGIRVHLSHLHLSHPAMFGRGEELVRHLERAAAEGVAVSWDTYPYGAGSSILHSYLPRWVQDGGPEAIARRLAEEPSLAALEQDPEVQATDWSKVVIAGSLSGRHVGQSVADLAQGQGTSPARAMARLLLEEDLSVACIVHQTLEADDLLIAEGFGTVVGSDGIPYGQKPHPRHAGAFAAFFRRHVRERRAMTAREAIERMSARPARLAGLKDCGEVAPGKQADLAAVDLAAYTDRSTYAEPRRLAEGVRHVFVAGEPILKDGVMNAALRPGRVLSAR